LFTATKNRQADKMANSRRVPRRNDCPVPTEGRSRPPSPVPTAQTGKKSRPRTASPTVLNSGDLNTELIRIAYVAMTRPRKLLVVSVPKTKTTLSRFSTALWDYQEL